jgi:hypothetical protein
MIFRTAYPSHPQMALLPYYKCKKSLFSVIGPYLTIRRYSCSNTGTFEHNGSAYEERKSEPDLDDTVQINEDTDDGFRIVTGCKNCINEEN